MISLLYRSRTLLKFARCSALLAAAFVSFAFAAHAATAVTAAYNYQILDDPLGVNGTVAYGISDSTVVGVYVASGNIEHGFVYNGTGFATIDDPQGQEGTSAQAVDGANIVGDYSDVDGQDHGFLYDGSTFTTIDDPSASTDPGYGTFAFGIDGANIVGYYVDSTGLDHGFVYNGTAYTDLDDPLGAEGTYASGVDGPNIVGAYYDAKGKGHGFLYNGTAFVTINDPLGAGGTFASGISGANITGLYLDSKNIYHGFLYNGTTYATLNDPLASTKTGGGTLALDIDGTTVVGGYVGNNGLLLGFVAVPVPPPTIISITGNQTVLAGNTTKIVVTANSSAALSYQWQLNGSSIRGATKATYSIARVAAANAGAYSVVVSSSQGSVTSNISMLTVVTPVKITTQPKALTVTGGNNATFAVVVSSASTTPLSYQWQFSNTTPASFSNISGANGITHMIIDAIPGDQGSYRVIVSNGKNGVTSSATSSAAKLTVKAAPKTP